MRARWLVLLTALVWLTAIPAGAAPFEVPEDVKDGYLAVRSGPGLDHEVIGALVSGTANIQITGCQPGDDGGRSTKPWCRLDDPDEERWISSCCIVDSASTQADGLNSVVVYPQALVRWRCTMDYEACADPEHPTDGNGEIYGIILFTDGVRIAVSDLVTAVAHYCVEDWREYRFTPPTSDARSFGCRAEISGGVYRIYIKTTSTCCDGADFADYRLISVDTNNWICSGTGRWKEPDLPMPGTFGPMVEDRWALRCPPSSQMEQ